MEYKNIEKTDGENSSSLTKPKNGLKVTKGKETRVDGWEWKDQGGGNKGHIRFCIYNVGRGAQGGLYKERRQVVILQYLTTLMDSDDNGVSGGTLVMGYSSKHNVTHLIVD